MLDDFVFDAYARDVVAVLSSNKWLTYREIAEVVEVLRQAENERRWEAEKLQARREFLGIHIPSPFAFLRRFFLRDVVGESSATKVWEVLQELHRQDFLIWRIRTSVAHDPEKDHLEYHVNPAKRLVASRAAERLPDVPSAALAGASVRATARRPS